MPNQTSARRARRALDARFARLGPQELFTTPRDGWVRAIRQALGMTAADLGSLLGVTRQSVLAQENSEIEGATRIDTLRRAANAMDCTFVYAFVPNRSLEETVRTRAAAVVDQVVRETSHSMALEGQAVPMLPAVRLHAIDDLIRTGNPWHALDSTSPVPGRQSPQRSTATSGRPADDADFERD